MSANFTSIPDPGNSASSQQATLIALVAAVRELQTVAARSLPPAGASSMSVTPATKNRAVAASAAAPVTRESDT